MSELPISGLPIIGEDAALGAFLDTLGDSMKIEVDSVFKEALAG